MSWVGHVGSEIRNSYKTVARNLKGREHLGDLGVDVKIILKKILKKMALDSRLDSCGYG
jgi:hypothetical protein